MSLKKNSPKNPEPPLRQPKEAFQRGLHATKHRFLGRLGRWVVGKKHVGEEELDTLEEALLAADVDLDTTQRLLNALIQRVKRQPYLSENELFALLGEEMMACLPLSDLPPYPLSPNATLHVVLLVGVNGVGKTTTAARLAHAYVQRGASVCLGAADTFRAAAIDQLAEWGERLSIAVISKPMGSDPSAVAFDTLKYAQDKGIQVAIIDTAGRLHNKKHLMDELAKLHRVMGKACPGAPHESLLVLDATTGQNAFAQADAFLAATSVNGIVLTKLDGTAKGGVLLGIASRYALPIRYVGLGEQLDDLTPFSPQAYVEALYLSPSKAMP